MEPIEERETKELTILQIMPVLDVPAWKTVLSWIAMLNGSGVLLFALFRRLLQGGH